MSPLHQPRQLCRHTDHLPLLRPEETAGSTYPGLAGALVISENTTRFAGLASASTWRHRGGRSWCCWLMASFLPAAESLHQAVLILSLIAFPARRVRGLTRWLLAAVAVPVGFGFLPQVGVAALFALIALLVLVEGRRDTRHRLPDDRSYRRGGSTRRLLAGLASASGSFRSNFGDCGV